MHTIKPIDIIAIKNSSNSKLLVSLEEHNIIGGLGSAISEVLSDLGLKTKLLRLGIKDTYSKGGSYKHLLEKSRLTQKEIIEDVLKAYT
tara:strand:- start:363 stop:629 length:267 start_codon:yes stop_codon:yes gene_type:complete